MSIEHDFPPWLDNPVEDQAAPDLWHDGTIADQTLTITYGLCAVGAVIFFHWTLGRYSPLMGGWWIP